MSRIVTRSSEFLFGFTLALLPAIGPFVAILLFVFARLRARRHDLPWALGALLFSVPPAVAGDVSTAVAGLLQLTAGWLIFRAFLRLTPTAGIQRPSTPVGLGLLVGLAVVIAASLANVEAWNFATAKTIANAIVWERSPALFAHTALVMGGLIAIVTRMRMIGDLALALAAVGILVSGSREAAVAWLIVAIVVWAWPLARRWTTRCFEFTLVALMFAITVGLGPWLGWGHVGFLVQPAGPATSGNPLQGTELPAADWWDASRVQVIATEAVIHDDPLVAYTVAKQDDEDWLQLQQPVAIAPNTTHTVSTWILAPARDATPGIHGWGVAAGGAAEAPLVVSGYMTRDGWTASVRGRGRLVNAGVADRSGSWSRVFISFAYEGDRPLPLVVGLTPDLRDGVVGASSTFAGFQLETGSLSAYRPGPTTRAMDWNAGRMPLWTTAWNAFLQKPWLGWGQGAYPGVFLARHSDSGFQVAPAHPHNAFLHVLFERGVVGFLGLLAFFGAVVGSALARRDARLLAVMAAVGVANLFDATLLHGGVFYPLMAVAGWRVGLARSRSVEEAELSRRVGARVGLAVADVLASFSAYLVAWGAASLWMGTTDLAQRADASSGVMVYALLLVPLLSWREGLYPGYGLTPHQELKMQATVVLYAGLLVLAGLVLLPGVFPVPLPILVLAWLMSLITLPAGRALAKRTLHAWGIWGRSVVVVGAGATGARIVRALQRTPLDGLHPVALFDDDPELLGRTVHGVEIVGRLDDVEAFASRYAIPHAIVAIPSLAPGRLRALLDSQRRGIRIVQHVPNLAGLPAEAVVASSLDGMLALEVRNNLALRRNRVSKRGIDLVAGTVSLILLAPLLFALAFWVRFDSEGPALHASERVGEAGERFACWKFRTMVVDAEDRLSQMMQADPRLREEYARYHKLENDPRITRAGRFLRTYSLDELPQLINVVMGQMSMAGPRPYLVRERPDMGAFADVILQAKPGMTGYWQVSERNEVSFRERLEMEAHYVRNWSIWWDIVILIQTVPAMLEKRGK